MDFSSASVFLPNSTSIFNLSGFYLSILMDFVLVKILWSLSG